MNHSLFQIQYLAQYVTEIKRKSGTNSSNLPRLERLKRNCYFSSLIVLFTILLYKCQSSYPVYGFRVTTAKKYASNFKITLKNH